MLYFPSVCRLLCRCAVSIQTAAHEMLSVRACFKHGLREQAVLKRAPEKENDYAICYNTARTPWDDSSGSAESGNRKRSGSDQFVFQPGALFCHLLLADEINRTSSKTQAALLEAMEEGNVTVEGKTYALPQPHLVIATQNPLGCVGTQSLPESQLDRFLMRLHMGYPEIDEEVAILRGKAVHNPLEDIRPVCTPEHLRELQQQAAAVYVDDRLYYYAASIAKATREHPQVTLGVSPRGTLALVQSAKAMAMLRGRNYLLPDDITQLCMDVLAHRILTKGSVNVGRILDEILHQVPAPVPDRR